MRCSLTALLLGLAAATTATNQIPIGCPPDESVPSDYASYAFTLKVALNFDFLSGNVVAAAQLCNVGGAIVNNALGTSGAATWGIVPSPNAPEETLGYVASTLIVRAPAGYLEELNDQLDNSDSRLYHPKDALALQVAQQIDDRFNVTLSEFLVSFPFIFFSLLLSSHVSEFCDGETLTQRCERQLLRARA